MRTIVAVACVIALLPAGAFGQGFNESPAPPATSPFLRAIASAAGGPSLAQDHLTPENWAQLRQTQPGTELSVTLKGHRPAKVRLLFANDSTLFVLDPTDVKLARRVERVLIQLTDSWPGLVSGSVSYRQLDDVRVTKDGVFDHGRKIGALSQVVKTVAREDVSDVVGLAPPTAALPATQAGSHVKRNALIGLGIGLGAGVALGVGIGVAMEGQADAAGMMALGGLGAGIGAGVGAIVGKASEARAARSFTVAPVVTRRGRAVLLYVSF